MLGQNRCFLFLPVGIEAPNELIFDGTFGIIETHITPKLTGKRVSIVKEKQYASDEIKMAELQDDQLELVAGGTGMEEEEEIPTFEDEWAAHEAFCAGKRCITCDGCGRSIVIESVGLTICRFCGRQY